MQLKIRKKNQTPHQFIKKSGAGFTLIELLVVIAIIGLLASVVLVALNNARVRSRDAKRIGDMTQMSKAMELFFNQYFSYPTSGASVGLGSFGILSAPAAGAQCGAAAAGCVNNFVPAFVFKLPTAPIPGDVSSLADCGSAYGGATANDYQIAGTNGALTASTYTITFCLGAGTGSFIAGIHTLTPSGIK